MITQNKNWHDFVCEQQRPEHIFIVGGGPSIQRLDLSPLKQANRFVIVCNQSFLQFPHATIAHHSDYHWWKKFGDDVLQHFKGQCITGCGLGSNQVIYPDYVHHIAYVQSNQDLPLMLKNQAVYGNNSGLQALSLAHLFAPRQIILLGFDFCMTENQSHHYAVIQQDKLRLENSWRAFLKGFNTFERSRQAIWSQHHSHTPLPDIYNLNPISQLKLYDRHKKLEDFL